MSRNCKIRRRTRLAVGALLACSAMGSEALAQDKDFALEEIIVTARKTQESAQETPVAISAFSQQDVERHQIVNAVDLQYLAPSVYIQQGQASPYAANLSFRGISQTVTILALEPPIAVYSDGYYFGSGVGFMGLGLLDIQRVEVLKGPQGTLYGRNTTGGALALYNNQPTDAFEGSVSVGAGNLGLVRGKAVLNVPIVEGKAALRLAASFTSDEGYAREITTGQHLQDMRSRYLRGILKLNPTEQLQVTVNADYSRSRSGGYNYVPLGIGGAALLSAAAQTGKTQPAILAEFATFRGGVGGDIDRTIHNTRGGADLDTAFGGVTVAYDLDNIQLKSITGVRFVNEGTFWDIDGTPYLIFEADPVAHNKVWTRQWTQEFNATGKFMDDRLTFATGLFYSHMYGRDLNVANLLKGILPQLLINAYEKTTSHAAYGQASFALTDTLNITGGLRYTKEKKVLDARNFATPTSCGVPPPAGVGGVPCRGIFPFEDSNVSYLAGLDWTPQPGLMLYATTSRGFRSGGVGTRTSALPASVTPFQSEIVYSHEAGFKSDWFDRRMQFNTSVYYQDYKNIQSNEPFLAPNGALLNVIQNAATAVIYGVETEAKALVTRSLLLAATLSYTHPEYKDFITRTGVDKSAQKFQNVSKWSYSLSGTYTYPVANVGDLSISADWYWRGKANMFPSNASRPDLAVQAGYGLLNAKAQLTVDRADLDVSVWAKNIADKRVEVNHYDALGFVSAIYNQPRTFGVDVTKRF